MAFMGYSFYLLLLYLFTYSVYESSSLASFERYEKTIIMGFILLFLMLILNELHIRKHSEGCSEYLKLLVVLVLTANLVPDKPLLVFDRQSEISRTRELRAVFDYIHERILLQLSEDDKVYIIAENSSGLGYWIPRYELTLIHT